MLKIAVVQGGFPEGVEENVSLMEKRISEAAKHGADLVLFCESFLGGYVAGDNFAKYAITLDGDVFKRVLQIARSNSARPRYSRPRIYSLSAYPSS